MTPQRFDLNLLASLDALLSERNVTAAANRLGVSQPTMSGMLQRLRVQLCDLLLVRPTTATAGVERAGARGLVADPQQ
jgi:DNA-binding transcriptional LysR family regulator